MTVAPRIDPVRTTCPYCGVGCGVVVDPTGAVTGDKTHPANAGRLCSKGAALGETLDLGGRLLHPEIDMNESPATAGTGPVFRGYDQAALDAQYNNRLKVPSFEDYLRRYHDDSAAVRQQWGDRARFDVAVGDSAIERVDVFPPLEGGRGSAPVPSG